MLTLHPLNGCAIAIFAFYELKGQNVSPFRDLNRHERIAVKTYKPCGFLQNLVERISCFECIFQSTRIYLIKSYQAWLTRSCCNMAMHELIKQKIRYCKGTEFMKAY